MNRLKQKNDLFVKLGALFGPLQDLVDRPDAYNDQEKAEVIARYCNEYWKLGQEFHKFTTGQPGHNYSIQYHRFERAIGGVVHRLTANELLEKVVSEELAKAQAAIGEVPVSPASVILEAGSPFTTYCRLRELCEVDATTSLVWLDPYHRASVFHRYITSVKPDVPVTLVTSEPGEHAGKQSRQGWAEFLEISRLYALERGPELYKLIVHPTLHDRWVVLDEKRIYALGGSAKDAGNKDYFTISSVEGSLENLAKIKSHIETGSVFFGPDTPTHL